LFLICAILEWFFFFSSKDHFIWKIYKDVIFGHIDSYKKARFPSEEIQQKLWAQQKSSRYLIFTKIAQNLRFRYRFEDIDHKLFMKHKFIVLGDVPFQTRREALLLFLVLETLFTTTQILLCEFLTVL